MCSSHKTKLIIKSTNSSNTVTVSGYAAVFNLVDLQGDIILKGAFKNISQNSHQIMTNEGNIKLLWQHDSSIPIGLIARIYEDEYGIKVDALINHHIQKGQEAIALIQQGVITNFSIGFTIENAIYNSQGNREIKSATLWEVSLVTFPANQYAKIYSLKTANINDSYTVRDGNSISHLSLLNCLIKAQASLNNLK